ncbi:tyrosine-type recombinase/integrase [Iningainema tapete]|uniref:Phage integrase family protein n=1 Tax=Iningainema tapete BLCC-T55 TaxID=2748662 RepID=A0A8J7CBR1_9CYAN|nr:tyrosine-type recombinase/integrase [Iningainema tapete]MBD2778636.1 phage integrase family protein [Iningainema tapete BLCC-T55]
MSATSVDGLVLTTPLALTEHPASVYLSSLGESSEVTMRYSLNLIAKLLTDGKADYLTLNWAALRYKHTAAIRSALVKNYEPATVNKALCALRRVLKEALRLELMSPADYTRAVDIDSVRVSKELRGRALAQSEINALMKICFKDLTGAGFRDAALIGILRGTGLRRSEVANLYLKNFNAQTGEIKIVAGKGRVDRTVYLPETAVKIVNDWVEIRTTAPGPLLCHVNKAGRVILKKLTPQAIMMILKKRQAEAGVEGFSPHDLRRTFVSDLLDAGVDIGTVQNLAGHSSPAITVRYDRRGEERKRRAVESLHIPQR